MYKLQIIINSCKPFYKTTMPVIIESAKKAKIPLNDIYFVIGEMDDNECREEINEEGVNIIYTNFVNIDYNGIMYFTQTEKGFKIFQEYTHFFYIHDTCEFLENFMEIIQTNIPECIKCKRSSNGYSNSIGLVNTKWFIDNRKNIFSYLINYDHLLKEHLKCGKPWANLETNEYRTIIQLYNVRSDNYNEDYLFEFNGGCHLGPYFANDIDKKTVLNEKYSSNTRCSVYNYKLGIVKHSITPMYGISKMEL